MNITEIKIRKTYNEERLRVLQGLARIRPLERNQPGWH